MVIPVREERSIWILNIKYCGGMVPYDLGLLGCRQIAPSAVGGREKASEAPTPNSFVGSLRYCYCTMKVRSSPSRFFSSRSPLSLSISPSSIPKSAHSAVFLCIHPRVREAMRVARLLMIYDIYTHNVNPTHPTRVTYNLLVNANLEDEGKNARV